MKKSKFTEAQILFALNQAETGTTVAEVCRKMGGSVLYFIGQSHYDAFQAILRDVS